MHLSFVGFSVSSRNVSLTTVLYLAHWLPPVLHVIYMQYNYIALFQYAYLYAHKKYNMYIEQLDMYNYDIVYSHTTYT